MFFAFPKIQDIEAKKENLVTLYTQFEEIQKSWLSYEQLQTAVTEGWWKQDAFTKNLLTKVDKDFYTEHMSNSLEWDYVSFLNSLSEQVFEFKSSQEFKDRESTIDTLLPYYSPENIFNDDELTDFHFVNYIENLLYTFNLDARGDIGVGNIQKVAKQTWEKIYIWDEGIFAIPLSFQVVGRKSDMVEFLHYFENVGSIVIQDNEVAVYDDEFIARKFQWERQRQDYNIYRNQASDIESLFLTQYPDSSAIKSDEDLISLMKWDQAQEKIQADIVLHFYVAGVPWYKMEDFIKNFLEDFNTLSWEIKRDAGRYKTQIYNFDDGERIRAISTLESLSVLMVSLDEDVKNIRTSLAKRDAIDDLYNKVIEHDNKLKQIAQSYAQQIQILTK